MELEQYRDTKYYISKDGRVFRELKQCINSNGYSCVHIDRKSISVHRLVGEVYLSDWDPDKTINHIDFNKQNNSINNLECVSISENIVHFWKGRKRGVI